MDNARQDPPRDPARMLSMMYFISSIGAGILMANNWPRLGKPEWRGATLLLAMAIPIGSIAVAIGLFLALISVDVGWLGFIPAFGALGANFGFVWSLQRMQSPAYKKFNEEGREAMLAHQYDVEGALTFGLGVVAAAMIVGAVLGFLNR